jgi:hypothetical protein
LKFQVLLFGIVNKLFVIYANKSTEIVSAIPHTVWLFIFRRIFELMLDRRFHKAAAGSLETKKSP